ncbi:MAG TPA: rubrerythrin family protein [Desulfobacterales bacterium]|nr:rubrerythrin family protein [Desulfobacterales bacterium]HIP38715.1 rubrerythrin family protein [Desulfocapsa sulfexigens]
MDAQTRQHTEEIFLTISLAAARTKVYALRAEKDGCKQLAKLLYAIAVSEDSQAIRLLFQLRGQIGKNEQNFNTAFVKEIPGFIAKYEEALITAEKAGERAMQSVFQQSAKVHQIHLNLKKKLDNAPLKENAYHVCTFCGFIMENHAPEKCPICTAPASRFTKI